ncbi:MAG: septum site-determining protein MinC [Gammaproteobacteria bacterium]|jgi:septum site-determining protein MinC|nr:septum site-determining protein MinC [Gammaproteobacteria bacterium]MBT4607861.1 septum site-determining protein MinC [Thiotrichales bacterium]MBT3471252.1 septum site-determining protein MinC [Gammaproteobacteria bacterium]MBT3966295.1 septum site-determining protein MinC [Gammaproteobacteria bacterium]MBT4079790.1 septum site-determining protein MinC [Gammaproteobacteria bacterium]
MVKKPVHLTGSMLSLTLLKIYSDSITEARSTLEKNISQAPDFFTGIPVLLEPQIPLEAPNFLSDLLAFLQESGMVPIGIRTADPATIEQAQNLSLPILPVEKRKSSSPPTEAKRETNGPQTAMIIHQPVRSGQQIYAKGRDLIVLGAVNPGAEVAADGNIHIYGKVRGKVFAGSSGAREVKIFAQSLDPELICIAGLYQLADNIEECYKQGFTEISLQEDNLVFNTITS